MTPGLGGWVVATWWTAAGSVDADDSQVEQDQVQRDRGGDRHAGRSDGGRVVGGLAHDGALTGESEQWDGREGDAQGEHDLGDDQRLGGSTPIASTTSAGIRVMVRRSSSGIRRRSRPSMLTAPA